MGSKGGWESFGRFYTFQNWGEEISGWMGPDSPKMKPLPAPVEEIDLEAQQDYTKRRIKSKKGRSSTILGNNSKGKTVLG